MNIDTFIARFRKAAQEVAAPQSAMQKIVAVVEADAKRRAPVRTGNLRRSITGRTLSPLRGVVGSNVHYARFVHDGTSRMRARPFITDAIAGQRLRIRDILVEFGDEVLGGIAR